MQFLKEQESFVGKVEASRVERWCSVMNGGRPRARILLLLMQWRHTDMAFSDWSHVEMIW